jgi:hypothetical protein
MPNDCWNHITITCENDSGNDELNQLIKNELQSNDGEDYYYHETVTMIKRGRRGIIFDIWSAWNPNYEWLESLLNKYPNCWIKNEWSEEGGLAGVWVGFMKYNNQPIIQTLTWDDISIEGKAFLFMDEKEEKEYKESRK